MVRVVTLVLLHQLVLGFFFGVCVADLPPLTYVQNWTQLMLISGSISPREGFFSVQIQNDILKSIYSKKTKGMTLAYFPAVIVYAQDTNPYSPTNYFSCFLFGGRDASNYYNDLYSLDSSEPAVTILQSSGPTPSPSKTLFFLNLRSNWFKL